MEFDNEKKKKDDEIRMLKEDLDNEKDNVKNLKIERKELFAQVEEFKKKESMAGSNNDGKDVTIRNLQDKLDKLKVEFDK